MGNKFFADGSLVELVLQVGGDALARVVDDFSGLRQRGEQFMVRRKCLETPCYTMFHIGDRVRSTLKHETPFVGTVVGYEYAANRVICVSEKILRYRNDRTRYAYGMHEIEQYEPQLFNFEDGKRYLVNHIIPVRAIRCYPHVYKLVADTGTVLAINLTETVHRTDLALKYGIFTIKPF